jgi:nucleoside-diphosphate-sugar epimerase
MERLRKGGEEPLYAAQYFQYGRYLLLAVSRAGALAFNNHNVWLDNMQGRWQGRWTLNINLQECYWPAENTNMAHTNQALLEFVENLAQAARENCRGRERLGGRRAGHLGQTGGHRRTSKAVRRLHLGHSGISAAAGLSSVRYLGRRLRRGAGDNGIEGIPLKLMTEGSIRTVNELERELSRPSGQDVDFLRRLEGDILILGVGGKMGPSLARLCRNSSEAAGKPRRIIAVSRNVAAEPGIEAIPCDLLDRAQVAGLPDCSNVLYLAGRKFGSSCSPELTWAMNTIVPAIVAEKFKHSRIVLFSTGNVYPFRKVSEGGCRESEAPAPVGEYAQSCLGRERVFEYYSRQHGLECLFYRLNYAVDLRYGVLMDIGRKVHDGRPVELSVPAFNVIWQRDANSYALRSLDFCATPPRVLNVTGPETLRVRDTAEWFGERFGRPCNFSGAEGPTALLSDASTCFEHMGRPQVSAAALMEMAATWIENGGKSIDKPTHFEVSDGRF